MSPGVSGLLSYRAHAGCVCGRMRRVVVVVYSSSLARIAVERVWGNRQQSTKQLRKPKFARPAITERRRRLIRGNEANERKTQTFALLCGKSEGKSHLGRQGYE